MDTESRLSTGAPGADTVLSGGLVPNRSYMLHGEPGTGKTIFALQFLLAGIDKNERVLYITFEESVESIRQNATRLGFDTSAIEFLDLTPQGAHFTTASTYDIFSPDEVESAGFTEPVREAITTIEPDRVVIDPITRLRQLSPNTYQFRQQLMAFFSFLSEQETTVLFTTQPVGDRDEFDYQYLSDGTLTLGYAKKGRIFSVNKFRGSSFMSGDHTLRITDTGLVIYPKLIPQSHRRSFDTDKLSTGVSKLDSLLNGGIERGTITILSGSSGVGKTTTGTHFIKESAARGERSVAYLFDEVKETFTHRAESIGIPITEMLSGGHLSIEEVEPLAVSPDEFAAQVRTAVEQQNARTVLLDGLSGYRLSIRGDEDELIRELHALCRYLKNMGVTTILTDDVGGVAGALDVTSTNISYLADTIVFFRYVEVDGELRKSIGILKKRISGFDRTLREFEITDTGIQIGEPLRGLQGVLTGVPQLRDLDP